MDERQCVALGDEAKVCVCAFGLSYLRRRLLGGLTVWRERYVMCGWVGWGRYGYTLRAEEEDAKHSREVCLSPSHLIIRCHVDSDNIGFFPPYSF